MFLQKVREDNWDHWATRPSPVNCASIPILCHQKFVCLTSNVCFCTEGAQSFFFVHFCGLWNSHFLFIWLTQLKLTIPKIRPIGLTREASLPSKSSESKRDDFNMEDLREKKERHDMQRLRSIKCRWQWRTERLRYGLSFGARSGCLEWHTKKIEVFSMGIWNTCMSFSREVA